MIVATSVLLLAAVAAPAPKPDTFEITVGGAAYATEEFSRVEDADGVTVSGKVAIAIPGGGAATLTQVLKLAADGHPLSYAVDVDGPGQQVSIAAKPGADGYALSITSKGASEPLDGKVVAAASPAFLLDNNFASHLDALTRKLIDLKPGEERTITAIVPQVLQAIPAKIGRGPDGKATLGGTAVATRSYRLAIATLGTELLARDGDGALLQAEVPMQKALLTRQGFVRPAAQAAAPDAPAPAQDPREKAMTIPSPAGALPATLLVPKSESPLAAILLLSGSGPNDKDETIGPNKPFADIARGLGDRGIASLRVDKRTLVIKDKSKFADVRLKDEYYDDAKLAIALLAKTPGVDPKRIFVVGHSEGAMVAPAVAGGSTGTRGIVMMAPGVRPIDAVLIDQMERGAKLMGRDTQEIAEQTKLLKETFTAIRDPERKDTPPFMGAPAGYWRELIALDVTKAVQDSKLPILVLQGDEDAQVRKDLDFELLKKRAGTAGGRVTYRSFPDLNHLFMKVDHESTGAEYGFPGTVDPAVVKAIGEWILAH